MANLKVGIYCRLSEEDKNKQSETDDSNSIQNQKSMLIQYALEQGWDIYRIYSDDTQVQTGTARNLRNYYPMQSMGKSTLCSVKPSPVLPVNWN